MGINEMSLICRCALAAAVACLFAAPVAASSVYIHSLTAYHSVLFNLEPGGVAEFDTNYDASVDRNDDLDISGPFGVTELRVFTMIGTSGPLDSIVQHRESPFSNEWYDDYFYA